MVYGIVKDDVFEVKMACYSTDLNQVSINVLHYLCTRTTGASATNIEFGTALDTDLAPLYKNCLAVPAVYYGVELRRILPLPRMEPTVIANVTGNGLGGTVLAAAQLSLVLTKKTGFAGRSNRGRFYVPFPSTSDIAATTLPTVAYVSECEALGTGIIGPFDIGTGGNTARMELIVYRRASFSGRTVSSIRTNERFGTQRRRGEYGRTNAIPPF